MWVSVPLKIICSDGKICSKWKKRPRNNFIVQWFDSLFGKTIQFVTHIMFCYYQQKMGRKLGILRWIGFFKWTEKLNPNPSLLIISWGHLVSRPECLKKDQIILAPVLGTLWKNPKTQEICQNCPKPRLRWSGPFDAI